MGDTPEELRRIQQPERPIGYVVSPDGCDKEPLFKRDLTPNLKAWVKQHGARIVITAGLTLEEIERFRLLPHSHGEPDLMNAICAYARAWVEAQEALATAGLVVEKQGNKHFLVRGPIQSDDDGYAAAHGHAPQSELIDDARQPGGPLSRVPPGVSAVMQAVDDALDEISDGAIYAAVSKMDALRAERDALGADLLKVQLECIALRAEMKEWKDQVAAYAIEVTFYRDCWLAQRAENEIFRKQLGLVPVCDEAGDEIIALRAEAKAWEDRAVDRESTHQELNFQVNTLRAEVDRLQSFLLSSTHGEEYERLRAEVAALTDHNMRLQDTHAPLLKEITALRAEVEEQVAAGRQKELEAVQLFKECQSHRAQLDAYRVRIVKLENERDELREQLDRTPIDWDVECDALQRSNDALRAQVAERADEHNYYEELLNSKDARIAELEQLLLGEQKLGDWLAAANDDIGERLEATMARIAELEKGE